MAARRLSVALALPLFSLVACAPVDLDAPPPAITPTPSVALRRDDALPVVVPLAAPARAPRRADLSGDGAADVAVGAPARNTVTVFVSDAAPLDLTGAAGRFGAAVAYPGDLDADGYPDLAVGAPDDDAVYLFGGTTGGVERTPRAVLRGAPGSGFGATLCAAGDLDGDGRDDLIIGSVAAGAISLVRGGTGAMPAHVDVTLQGPPQSGYAATIVAFADGSGRLAVGVPREGAVAIVTARDGRLRESARLVVSSNPVVDLGLAALDADGDGHADLAVTGGGLGGIVWIRGTHDGFAAPTAGPSGSGAGTLLVGAGDLDGDGDDELLVASGAGLWVLPGDRAGTSTLRPWDLGSPGNTAALAVLRDDDAGPATVLRGVPTDDAVERLKVDSTLAATTAPTLFGARGAAFGSALAR